MSPAVNGPAAVRRQTFQAFLLAVCILHKSLHLVPVPRKLLYHVRAEAVIVPVRRLGAAVRLQAGADGSTLTILNIRTDLTENQFVTTDVAEKVFDLMGGHSLYDIFFHLSNRTALRETSGGS